MWEVCREHDAVVTETFKYVLGNVLVCFDSRKTLSQKILAGPERQRGIDDLFSQFVVFVHAPQPEGQPAAVAFEKGEPNARETFTNTAADDRQARIHRRNRMRGNVLGHPQILVYSIKALTDGDRKLTRGAFMESD